MDSIDGRGSSSIEGSGGGGGGGGGAKDERIVVSVRLRPLNDKEIYNREPCEWDCMNDNTIVFRNSLPERSMFPVSYTFDRVFGCECPTWRVYDEAAREVALSVVNGINSSVFAYGQTSSGKTYTMSAVTEYSLKDIYDHVQNKSDKREFVLKFSAMEIYNEAVRDLLSHDTTPLRLLDDPDRGTVVDRLTEETLKDWNHVKQLLSLCEAQRQIGETSLNETSSRSHQIIRLTVESSARHFLGKNSSNSLCATANFVDLAGSERASQTMTAGARLKEGCHINRSLLTLGTVIRKLSKGRSGGHIPYRDSKLTRILHSSLDGNARTAIICTMSPARSYVEQSRKTLLFASCAKEVTTSARVNVVMSDKALVKHLQKELERLESQLRIQQQTSPPPAHADALLKEKDVLIQKMETEMKHLMQQRDLAQSRLQDLVGCNDHDRHDIGFSLLKINLPEQQSASRNWVENISSPLYFDGLLQDDDGKDDITSDNNEEFENLCRDVKCIESTFPLIPPQSEEDTKHIMGVQVIEEDKYSGNDDSYLAVQLVKKKLDEPSPLTLRSRRSVMTRRSKSCTSSTFSSMSLSSWFVDDKDADNTLPERNCSEDFSQRPEGFTRRRAQNLTFGGESSAALSVEVEESQPTITVPNITSTEEDNIVELHDFVTGMKDVANTQMVVDKKSANEVIGERFPREPKQGNPATESSESWAIEFEKQLQEIIALWHECHVSLIHRTYFFLLFKGDPSDSIYLEVELRRLSFLKRSFDHNEKVSKPTFDDGSTVTLVSSIRELRREREMLSKKMTKMLSSEEIETLYQKWGIALNSKQRRLQLSRLLWSKTGDLNHVRESASIIAKLVGLLEPGKALKEMFGLSLLTFQKNGSKRTNYFEGGFIGKLCI